MKNIPYIILLSLVYSVIAAPSFKQKKDNAKVFTNGIFQQGEAITYRLHYGFMNAGSATMFIDDKLYKVNEKPCLKMAVIGKSSSAFSLIVKIRDQWISYVDTNQFLPQKGYRFIREGKFKLDETVVFDQEERVATITQKHRDDEWKVEFPDVAYDLVSGYYFLRQIDYEHKAIGDTIVVDAVFEDKFYDFRVRFMGQEEVKTKFGKVRCYKLVPIMPENSLFSGEESIRLWMTADKNKIPVKVQADMYLGAVEIDINAFKNLLHPISFY